MAELAAFVDYEREFTATTSSLPTRINALLNYESNADSAQTELRRIKGEMSQAKQLAMDMEIAARGIGEPTRRELGNKIRIHKETLTTLGRDLAQAESKFDRSALMGSRAPERPMDFDKSGESRDRMAQATDKLRGGTNQLNDAHKRLEETIEVGAGVMSELDRNRETLRRVRENVSCGARCPLTRARARPPARASRPRETALTEPCAPPPSRWARFRARSILRVASSAAWAGARCRTRSPYASLPLS